MITRAFLVFVSFSVAVATYAEEARQPVHPKSIVLENVTVEYPEELAAQSGALAYWLDRGYPKYDAFIRSTFAKHKKTLQTKGQEDVDWLISQLGLIDQPDTTKLVYDKLSSAMEELLGDALLERLLFTRAYVISKEELNQRLNEHGFVDNVSHGDGDRPYRFDWGLIANGDLENDAVAITPSGRYLQLSLPIIIEDTNAPFKAQIENAIAKSTEFIDGLAGVAGQTMQYFSQLTHLVALHEAAEWTLARHTILSEDRRWFADGVANYLTKKRIFETAENPEKFWNALYGRRHIDRLNEVDLLSWKAAENESDNDKVDKELREAYYLLATATIEEIAKSHGEYFLPRLLKEVRKTKLEETNMNTVYAAFKSLTNGEDMKSYIEKARQVLLAQ